MFNSITTAGTGLDTYQTWLDAISNNIANVNDTSSTSGKVFQAQYVNVQSAGTNAAGIGQGVEVTSVSSQSGTGEIQHDPDNPLADADGNIRTSNVDLGQQLTTMIAAQRAFQANANVVTRSESFYQTAINIGKGV